MKIVALSDLHGFTVPTPPGDILIVAGDLTGHGRVEQYEAFAAWLEQQPQEHKLVIAGNHDLSLDLTTSRISHLNYNDDPELRKLYRTQVIRYLHDAGAAYLEDSSWEIDGVKFYGSPWTPEYYNWAFMLPRDGLELAEKWAAIPEDTNVLITHGPPAGILDNARDTTKTGDESLLRRLLDVSPRVHIFGHIHEGYGSLVGDNVFPDTAFYNVAICTIDYEPNNPVTVIDI